MGGDWTSALWSASIYVYYGAEAGDGSSLELVDVPPTTTCSNRVLLLADNFDKKGVGEGEDTTRPYVGWQRLSRVGENTELAESYVTVDHVAEHGLDTGLGRSFEKVLRLNPSIGWVALHRTPWEGLVNTSGGRLHIRAQFYDAMQGRRSCHWIGATTNYGAAALGIASDEFPDHYAFFTGSDPGAPNNRFSWVNTGVTRALGWHLLELVWQATDLFVLVDGEHVASATAACSTEVGVEDAAAFDDTVWLVAKRGDAGYWAAVEVFHTPPCTEGATWEVSARNGCLENGGVRWPWHQRMAETGRWRLADGQIIDDPTPVLRESCLVESRPTEIPAPPNEPAVPPPEEAAVPSGFITVECWSLRTTETELDRIERVVTTFVEGLRAAGVVLPENFQRLGRCGSRTDPQPCYIYRFGTRRIHMSVRELAGGRLCLVVRCGGGFMDFAEFGRKNGSCEQLKLLKLQRKPESRDGKMVVNAVSVLSNGTRSLRSPVPGRRAGA